MHSSGAITEEMLGAPKSSKAFFFQMPEEIMFLSTDVQITIDEHRCKNKGKKLPAACTSLYTESDGNQYTSPQ